MLRRETNAAVAYWLAALVLIGCLAAAWPAAAATFAWTSTSVRGVVVYLLDGKWQELSRGQLLTDATLRTLRGGRLSLESESITVSVGPNSALEVGAKGGASNTIQQYEGSIDVAVEAGPAAPLTLRAGTVTLTKITGELSISVTDSSTSVTIKSGTVAVASPGGRPALLGPGVYQTDTSGVLASQSDAVAAEDAPAGTKAVSTGLGNANGNGNAGGNGNGNSNAGGNGNGNGNAGGNGDGNAGGNGGGNGNGNAGGNGNGNGNAGGNGNGNGNNK